MTDTVEVYKGDSSDVFSVSVTQGGVAVTGVALADFSGMLCCKKTLAGDPAFTAIAMEIVGNTLQGQFAPSDTSQLDEGTYHVIIEVTNDDNTYKKEHHSKMKVLKPGY